MDVRMAQRGDAAGIAGLMAQLGYEAEAAAVADRLARILMRQDQRFLVAQDDGRLVGCIHLMTWELVETSPFVVIAGLVVDRACRGRGVGRALVAETEAWAREQGCPVVRLWSSIGRTEAHKFYEHLGYANIKTQYAFVKAVDPGRADLREFIPQIRE